MKLKLPGALAYIGGLLVSLVLVAYGVILLITYIPSFIQAIASEHPTVETIIATVFLLAAFVLIAAEGLTILPVAVKGLKTSLTGGDNDKIVKGTARIYSISASYGILGVALVTAMNIIGGGGIVIDWTALIFNASVIVLFVVGSILYRGYSRLVSLILFAIAPVLQLISLIQSLTGFSVDGLTPVLNILRFVSFALLAGGTIFLYVTAIIPIVGGKKGE